MKLTRKQELSLINLGFQKLLERLETPVKRARKSKPASESKSRKWTDAQREKFRATMKAKWAKRKKSAQ